MILIVALLIGVVDRSLAVPTSHPLNKRYCDDTTSLALIFGLNVNSLQYNTFDEVNKLIQININDILTREDLLFWLGDMCRSRSLTLEWLLRQAEKVCPHPHKIRSLIEPSGVVCNQNGDLTELTKTALASFVRVNKSYECEAALTRIQSQCEIDALFNVVVPSVPKQTLDTDIDAQTRRSIAAIQCTLPQLKSLTPDCGSVGDLRMYQLVSELVQKQPFKLQGNVDFETFSNLMT